MTELTLKELLDFLVDLVEFNAEQGQVGYAKKVAKNMALLALVDDATKCSIARDYDVELIL